MWFILQFYNLCKPDEQDKFYQKLFVIQNVYSKFWGGRNRFKVLLGLSKVGETGYKPLTVKKQILLDAM